MTSLKASMEKLADLPTPMHVTLLFKCHKSTTLLSVMPDQPFSEIKALLLAALKSRNIRNLPNSSTPLPSDPEDIEFGILADRKDPSKGWVAIEVSDPEVSDVKAGKRKSTGKKSWTSESPVGAGLVDGNWIAYRVNVAGQRHHENDMEANLVEEADTDEHWDVVLASFADEEED